MTQGEKIFRDLDKFEISKARIVMVIIFLPKGKA